MWLLCLPGCLWVCERRESVCLVNNICAFGSLCRSPHLSGPAVRAAAETEGGGPAAEGGRRKRSEREEGWLTHTCPYICVHPCCFICTTSVLCSSSLKADILREPRVAAVNNVELSARYRASASIRIKPPPGG